jgi:hypothetical protein
LKKRKIESEDDPLLLDDMTMELILQEENTKKTTLINNKEAPVMRNKVIIASEKDKRHFNDIEDIIKSIQESFQRTQNKELTHENVLDALKINSFNIVNTFLYLCNPEEYNHLCFNDVDDYIIKNMKNSDYYKDMVYNKGMELIKEREKFLMIDDINDII